jgi:hypothetical protein
MKINGLTPAGQGGEISKKQEQVIGPSFGSVLNGAMNGGAGNVTSTPAPFPAMPISPLKGINPSQQANKLATTMLENTLNDLQIYQNALSNQDIPASRLQPMAQKLMDSKDSLVSMLAKVDDSSLKGIISHTSSLIISENSRLNTALS